MSRVSRVVPDSPHLVIQILDTSLILKVSQTINFERAALRPLKSRSATRGLERTNNLRRSAHNLLTNKDFTRNPFNLKDLARFASKSLIPKDRM